MQMAYYLTLTTHIQVVSTYWMIYTSCKYILDDMMSIRS